MTSIASPSAEHPHLSAGLKRFVKVAVLCQHMKHERVLATNDDSIVVHCTTA